MRIVTIVLAVAGIALLMAGCGDEAVAPTATTAPAPTATPVPPTETSVPAETATLEDARQQTTGAGDANVEYVRAVQADDGTWTFHVTVRHPDTGWEDYADGWDVVTPDGTVLKANPEDKFTRVLLHPHENEQPFTRSQRGLEIPEGVTQVTVRAHDIVDGFGGQEVTVDLTQNEGEKYEVERR